MLLWALLFVNGCGQAIEWDDGGGGIELVVVDVGQGLSQIVKSGDEAILFDMGPQEGAHRWLGEFASSGTARVVAIVISHLHEDHVGGCSVAGEIEGFSGKIMVTPYVDTLALRNVANLPSRGLSFSWIKQGDTIGGLDGVRVRCLWPPAGLVRPQGVSSDWWANHTGSCFLISYGHNSMLLTADVDSSVLRQLAQHYGYGLQAQLLVVPHHGSAEGLQRAFYGYANPMATLISCGIDNRYGHPSAEVVEFMHSSGISMFCTAYEGTIRAHSNGYYWNLPWR
jgi:competence protein ComEC